MEVELKLLVDPDSAKDILDHPLLKKYAVSEPHRQNLSDIYFDTPDNHFRRSGAALRVRRVDDYWVQTLKAGGNMASGLYQRHEWESRVGSAEPDLSALKNMVSHKNAWGKLLRSPVVEDKLQPIFTTQVKRTVWELRLPAGDDVEFALDQGSFERDGAKQPISEMELELKSGNPLHILDFALELQEEIPVRIGNQSKSDRGYALFLQHKPQPVKAESLKLNKKMNIEQAFQAIVQNCMEQIQANEQAVAQNHDAESLHQMRVGLRRLRSGLGLFKEIIALPDDIQQDLDWLGTELGDARDWDVLAGSTLEAVESEKIDAAAVLKVKQAALAKANTMHEAVTEAVNSTRYARLILSLNRWVQGCGWRNVISEGATDRLTEKLTKFSAMMLTQDQKRLRKRGKQLQGANPEARHRVRIAAKRMRYDSEFFRTLYPAKKVKPYLKALSSLQDKLGWLNDAAVADKLLCELQDGSPELAANAAYIRGYLAARMETDAKKIHKGWKVLKTTSLPG